MFLKKRICCIWQFISGCNLSSLDLIEDDIKKLKLRSEFVFLVFSNKLAPVTGVFAIAFALHLAPGQQVKELEFDQAVIRHHIIKNSEHCKIFFQYRETSIFRVCPIPETYGDLVECEKSNIGFT